MTTPTDNQRTPTEQADKPTSQSTEPTSTRPPTRKELADNKRTTALNTLFNTYSQKNGAIIRVCTFPGKVTHTGNYVNRYRLFIIQVNPTDGFIETIDITPLVRDAVNIRWSRTYGYLMSYESPSSAINHLSGVMSRHIGQRIQYHSNTLF